MSKVELLYQRFLDYLRAYSGKKNIPFVEALMAMFKPQDKHALFAAALLGNGSPNAEEYLIQHYRPAFLEQMANGFLEADQAAVEAMAEKKMKEIASSIGKMGGDAKAAKLVEAKVNIRQAWASGNFASRDICAEQEYQACGLGSIKTARNALTGTPNPNPWPAKKRKRLE